MYVATDDERLPGELETDGANSRAGLVSWLRSDIPFPLKWWTQVDDTGSACLASVFLALFRTHAAVPEINCTQPAARIRGYFTVVVYRCRGRMATQVSAFPCGSASSSSI